MRSSLLAVAVLIGTSLHASQFVSAQTRFVANEPMLHFTTVANYAFGIAGTHWGDRVRVTVTLHANKQVQRVTVQTTRTGSFLIGVSSADLCRTTTAQGQDRKLHRKTLLGPDKACLVILEASPHLTVLRGKLAAPVAGG